MRHHLNEEESDPDFEDLPDRVPPHMEHLSRKWAEDGERLGHGRYQRQVLTRRRIEDWRDERALRREFEEELDGDADLD